jgi:two-component system, OmpR family, sensor kinase
MAYSQGPGMRSLRVTLAIWFIGLFTVVGLLAGAGTLYVSLRQQNALLDDQLRQIALSVSDSPSAVGESSRITSGANLDDEIVIHIRDKEMRTIRNSNPDVDIPAETQTGFSNHVSEDSEWRTFTLIAETRVIQVSQLTAIRKQAAMESALSTLLPIFLLIPLSWISVGWVLARVLRPLGGLASDLKNAQSSEGVRLAMDGIPSEVVPLVSAMNDLLERQKELMAAQERFISDAAHQLRTPVTALTLQVENLQRSVPDASMGAAFTQMRAGLARMSALLGQLLKLARIEAPQATGDAASADLSDIVRTALADAFPLAEDKNIDLGLEKDISVNVGGERLDLVMLVGNLIENAVRYTPRGGKIDIEVSAASGEACVSVTDTGPGIPEDALPRVFERFYRHAPQDAAGTGLGLSIVMALAARCGAEVSLQNRTGETGLVAKVTFKRV